MEPREYWTEEDDTAAIDDRLTEDDEGTVFYRVLSIDAWRNDGSWIWNAWYRVGSIAPETVDAWGRPVNARKALRWFRDNGYLKKSSAGKVAIEDDGYNIVVRARGTGEPLFAVEYAAGVY